MIRQSQTGILFLLLTTFCLHASAQKVVELSSLPNPETIVWTTPEREYFSKDWQTEVVTNVSKPTLTVYLPDPAIATGTALIIAPGGGYMALSINSEGNMVADWCVKHGIAAFVLKYRVAPTGEDGVAEFSQASGGGESFMQRVGPVIPLAIADGKAAIEYVRSHAAELGVKPDQIGIMGFSAGGTVVQGAVFDPTPASRPDFAVPIYPALQITDSTAVPENAMPLFIICSADDSYGFQRQSADLFRIWNRAGKPAELHLYERGGHGYGAKPQGNPSDQWLESFGIWLASRGWMAK